MKFEVKLTKEQIGTLNALAKMNWERAQGALDGINLILGTDYGWLAKRVVFHVEHDGKTECHDAYAWAEPNEID